MKLTGPETVAMFMHYVPTEDKPRLIRFSCRCHDDRVWRPFLGSLVAKH
jgi:hypothetical protein